MATIIPLGVDATSGQTKLAGAGDTLGGGGAPQPHKSTHVSGGSDAFLTTDLLDAIVQRLRETSGPTTLTMGAVSNGQVLTRSGTSIVGAASGSLGGLSVLNKQYQAIGASLSYVVPGGTLGADNDEILIESWGNTVIGDTIALSIFGTTVISFVATATTGYWISARVFRTSAGNVNYVANLLEDGVAVAVGNIAADNGTITASDTGTGVQNALVVTKLVA